MKLKTSYLSFGQLPLKLMPYVAGLFVRNLLLVGCVQFHMQIEDVCQCHDLRHQLQRLLDNSLGVGLFCRHRHALSQHVACRYVSSRERGGLFAVSATDLQR
jgi:hypothetical protein